MYHSSSLFLRATTALVFTLCTMPFAQAASLQNPGTLGGSLNFVNGISADGTIIIGQSYLPGDTEGHVYRWQNGVLTDIGTLGGSVSSPTAISRDGTTIVGGSSITGDAESHGFVWKNGTMTDLGTLGGLYSGAYAVSSNGNIIAGVSYMANGTDSHAFRWENGTMTDLGTLGGSNSMALQISADGSAIAGTSYLVGDTDQHIFYWKNGTMTDVGTLGGNGGGLSPRLSADGNVLTGAAGNVGNTQNRIFRWENNVMTDLGNLGGINARPTAISTTGDVIAGNSEITGTNDSHAFRWENNVMTDLGTLGGTTSNVMSMSADGSVIAGGAKTAGDTDNLLYRWTQTTGMQSLQDILTSSGVDLTGWSLVDVALGVMPMSADGTTIGGTAVYNGQIQSFIFSTGSGGGGGTPGLITPQALAESLQSVSTAAQQVSSVSTQQVGQTLFMARHIQSIAVMPQDYTSRDPQDIDDITPAAGGKARRGVAAYVIGGFGIGQNNDFDNNDVNGTVGVNFRLREDLNVGFGVLGAHANTDLSFDGKARTSARGVSSILAYEPVDNGLRLYGAAFVADIDAERTRGYMNGAGIDFSSGKTDGMAYGGAVQTGWQFQLDPKNSIMPYVELQASKTKLDGYSETGGAFAATFSDQDSTSVTSHIGVEHVHHFTPQLNVLGRLAWGHRLNNGNGDFTATSSGLTQTLGSNSDSDNNWAEATVGLGWQATDALHFNTELSGRSGDT